jgi:hypothetical protein
MSAVIDALSTTEAPTRRVPSMVCIVRMTLDVDGEFTVDLRFGQVRQRRCVAASGIGEQNVDGHARSMSDSSYHYLLTVLIICAL